MFNSFTIIKPPSFLALFIIHKSDLHSSKNKMNKRYHGYIHGIYSKPNITCLHTGDILLMQCYNFSKTHKRTHVFKYKASMTKIDN